MVHGYPVSLLLEYVASKNELENLRDYLFDTMNELAYDNDVATMNTVISLISLVDSTINGEK